VELVRTVAVSVTRSGRISGPTSESWWAITERRAIEILGSTYPICRHRLAQYPRLASRLPHPPPTTLIVIGFRRDQALALFTDYKLAGHNGNSEGIVNLWYSAPVLARVLDGLASPPVVVMSGASTVAFAKRKWNPVVACLLFFRWNIHCRGRPQLSFLSYCANCANYQLLLVVRDPVAALGDKDMFSSRQRLG
jgi:hypothetical protein